MKREIIKTADGSHSLFVPDLNEYYHSVHGAIQESMHVFIEAGLNAVTKKDLCIFELGYGTGLNFLLTYLSQGDKIIEYHGIEAFPLETTVIKELNYVQNLKLDQTAQDVFMNFHSNKNTSVVNSKLSINTTQVRLSAYHPAKGFDLIYFDAFAPEKQPELWSAEVFQKIFSMTNPGGILVTYCAKGQVRRNMQDAGYIVERLQGPPGKREMLRARNPG